MLTFKRKKQNVLGIFAHSGKHFVYVDVQKASFHYVEQRKVKKNPLHLNVSDQ